MSNLPYTYFPSFENFKSFVKDIDIIPVFCEIDIGDETPISVYRKVARSPYSFLLESVSIDDNLSRYSFIGTDPYKVIKTGEGQPDGPVDPLCLIKAEIDNLRILSIPELDRFEGGMVGYMGYESIKYFEDLQINSTDSLNLPESIFMLTTDFIVMDHVNGRIKIVSYAFLREGVDLSYKNAQSRINALINRLNNKELNLNNEIYPEQLNDSSISKSFQSNMSRDYYNDSISKIINYINQGECIQVVFSQRFEKSITVHPLEIYRSLRKINPSPYMFYLNLDGFQVVGASPEMLVRCMDGNLDYHPIAGTRKRGKTEEEDDFLANELRNSEKDKAEHIMLVDLGRNDIGKVSKIGTVNVTQLMGIEKYSHVMHLVSHIKGKLEDGLTCYDVLRSCFPAGTLSGAPKIRAMEIIADLEKDRRGVYGGVTGYISFSGNMDTAIALRTMVVKDCNAYVQAGGGIVADSNVDHEFQETVDKATALFHAIEDAEANKLL